MKVKYEISPLEKLVLDILLETDKGLSYENIIGLMPQEHEWRDRSVYVSLKHLKEYGLIEEAGKIKVARTRAILYRATMTKDEYFEAAYTEYFEKMSHSSLHTILSAVSGARGGRTQELVDELEAWLQNQKELLANPKEETNG